MEEHFGYGRIYDDWLADGSWAKGVVWYEHDVTKEELKELIDKCVSIKTKDQNEN